MCSVGVENTLQYQQLWSSQNGCFVATGHLVVEGWSQSGQRWPESRVLDVS